MPRACGIARILGGAGYAVTFGKLLPPSPHSEGMERRMAHRVVRPPAKAAACLAIGTLATRRSTCGDFCLRVRASAATAPIREEALWPLASLLTVDASSAHRLVAPRAADVVGGGC